MDEGTKVFSNGLGHMSNMGALFINGKNLKNFFFGTKMPMTLTLGMRHCVLDECHQVYSNDDPGLTLTY